LDKFDTGECIFLSIYDVLYPYNIVRGSHNNFVLIFENNYLDMDLYFPPYDGMVDFTGSGVRMRIADADYGLRMRIADADYGCGLRMRIADCEPMQIVYFFGKKPQ
jgi:hypothetical protein